MMAGAQVPSMIIGLYRLISCQQLRDRKSPGPMEGGTGLRFVSTLTIGRAWPSME